MAAIVAVVRGQQGLLAQVVVVVTAVIGLMIVGGTRLVSIAGKWQNILAAIVGTLLDIYTHLSPCACARLILDFAKRILWFFLSCDAIPLHIITRSPPIEIYVLLLILIF
ncbi:hypothetical protein ACJX0J_019192 [Zea mays]